jgi:hypothetical protein
VKRIASSFATRAIVIPLLLGAPRSSFFLSTRYSSTHLPSFGSSTYILYRLGTLQSPYVFL